MKNPSYYFFVNYHKICIEVSGGIYNDRMVFVVIYTPARNKYVKHDLFIDICPIVRFNKLLRILKKNVCI